MIVCQCVGATETTIRKAIARGAISVAEITQQTGAGRCCVPCRTEISEILSAAVCERDASDPDPPAARQAA